MANPEQSIERRAVLRLDQTLRYWEERCFLLNAETQLARGVGVRPRVPFSGPIVHYPDLRGHLLRSYDEEFDKERFLGSDMRIADRLSPLSSFPYALYEWSKHSRRIFRISEDLQVQLENTSLDGVLWSDVKFPFDAYGIELESPISLSDDTSQDFILVHGFDLGNRRRGIVIRMLPTKLDEVHFLSKKERQTVTNLTTRRKWDRLNRWLLEFSSEHPDVLSFPSFHLDTTSLDLPVLDTEALLQYIANLGDDRSPMDDMDRRRHYWRRAAELVVGFNLYLKQLPSSSPNMSDWQRTISTPDPTAITNEAEVCYITSTHPLTRDQIDHLKGSGRGGYEMPWHMRRGYWSRKPGQGHIPDAPKVVWHPPQEIRADRRPQRDSLPGGSQTNA